MTSSIAFALTDGDIKQALNALARCHPPIATALNQVGYPASRQREHSFESLARIVIGQQLSTKAAATIAGRVDVVCGGVVTPKSILATPPETLRAAGLSRQKIGYLQSLAETVHTGTLLLDALPQRSDHEVEAAITAVRGFGRWSAHMYMMFALGRPDVWPSGDLAVRVGFGRMMGWSERPSEQQVIAEGAAFSPYRSALALLCWHFYSEAPL
ncbi:MAG: DNA-3-methyladenine glycosylase 2 family protein [Luminiphilus sp.]|jgi:DNA-3-methyladenine glycosylase II|nr:DNA-3-methyladenine glycosylase 2 family protein [Luminiphilus sp.]